MQTKKRKMKAGEALVGMKRSGSQLRERRCVSPSIFFGSSLGGPRSGVGGPNGGQPMLLLVLGSG